MANSPFFDLVAAQMDEAMQAHRRQLNHALYASEDVRPVPPLTWRERMALKVARVRRYVMTLWDALKGRDPYDNDWDY